MPLTLPTPVRDRRPVRSTRLRATLKTALPSPIAVGRGTAVFLEGRCWHERAAIEKLSVLVGDDEHPVMAHGMPVPSSFAANDYWWGIASFRPCARPVEAPLRLRARLRGGGEAVAELGNVALDPGPGDVTAFGPPSYNGRSPEPPGEELVAICMATFNPPLDLFERQIESIRAQTYGNWVCVISDDSSDRDRLAEMEAIIGGDARFRLSGAPDRLGFYRNFERAIGLAPPEASFLALADQDDRWYPDKVATLRSGLAPEASLVYSDMQVVDRDGQVLSDTYWSYRRNNHTDFASLLIANTVTGAASLFRRDVLDYALPFPPRYEEQFHDHWIAAVAMALGAISYVDRPLYDYVQHLEAAQGHVTANASGGKRRRRPGRVERLRRRVRRWRAEWKRPSCYFQLYCPPLLTARVIEMRCGHAMAPAKRRVVRRLRSSERLLIGIPWLTARSLRSLLGATETFGRERLILLSVLWKRSAGAQRDVARVVARARAGRQRVAARIRGLPSPLRPGRDRSAPATHDHSPSGPAPPGGRSERWLEPILVDYFSRDGSTLMMRLLDSSAEIAVEGSYPYENKYFAYLWRWARLLDRRDWPEDRWRHANLGSLLQEDQEALIGPPPWLPRRLTEPGEGEEPLSERCFELAWTEFSRRASRRTRTLHRRPDADVRYYAEKHLNSWLLDMDELPPVRIVALLRDPRDTYVSMNAFEQTRNFASFGRDHAASEREHLDRVLSRQRQRLRWIAGLPGDGDVTVVRYDELVRDLPGVAHRLERWLGVELNPAAAARDKQLLRLHVTAGKPEDSIERWRNEMPVEVAEIFRAELGDELSELGFEA